MLHVAAALVADCSRPESTATKAAATSRNQFSKFQIFK